jgi:hypothetical protein
MSRPVRAKPFITQMRRGRLPARSCRHDQTAVDRPDRPSGRNASPSGITPSTIMSPARSSHGSRTEIRLGARAHTTGSLNRAHAPPNRDTLRQSTQLVLDRRASAQIRSTPRFVSPAALSHGSTSVDRQSTAVGTRRRQSIERRCLAGSTHRCLRGGREAPSAARWLAVARRRHRGCVGQGVDRCGLAIEECAELLDRAH